MDLNTGFLGIDLGTSGVRAIVIDQNQAILAQSFKSLPPSISLQTGWFEQNPQDWWDAVLAVIQAVIQQCPQIKIQRLAIDGTSGTILLCDRAGRPISPALMYNDLRATKEAKKIQQKMPQSIVATPSSSLSKLYWLSQNRDTTKARYALHQADWIANKLAGVWGYSDEHNALKCGYNAVIEQWEPALSQLPIHLNWLPKVKKSGDFFATIDPNIANLTGLSPQTHIISGTTDSTAGAMALGMNRVGQGMTVLGSSLVMKVISKQPYFNAKMGIYSHRLGKNWLVGGASNAGGQSLLAHFNLQQIIKMSQQIDPLTTHNLDYYPLISKGERFPINDPELMPQMTPRPAQDTLFYLGLIDGLVHIEKKAYQYLQHLGISPIQSILSIGGGTQNTLWQKRRKRILTTPLLDSLAQETAFGSALLAKGL